METPPANLDAYLEAQKARNLAIGFALLGFVALVFAISIAQLNEGLKHDRVNRPSIYGVSTKVQPKP